MKKLLLIYTLIFLFIVYVVLLYTVIYDFTEWFSSSERSWKDFLYFKKEDFVTITLILLSAVGLLIRERLGWVLTVQLFYSLLGTAFTIISKLYSYTLQSDSYVYTITVLLLVTPLATMNSASLKSFYRIQESESMAVNNALAITIAVLGGLLMW